jgi:hypothetical protein
MFDRFIGIDYSGAETPTSRLPGLRIYMAEREGIPIEVRPTPQPTPHWTRRELAAWLDERLEDGAPTIVGIDHGFSVPTRYFERHGLRHDWTAFLGDFCRHWPTDGAHVYVDFVRDGRVGRGWERAGEPRWKRLTEIRARSAKSVFQFEGQGTVAKSTHAGLPWLARMRERHAGRVHFWPFDGWTPPPGRSVVAEVYPSLWNREWPRGERTTDQHDAWSAAEWMRRADRLGALSEYFMPELSAQDKNTAAIEGWILGLR